MFVRGMEDGKYDYSAVHGGQHDAAELLGDILWSVTPGVSERRQTTAMLCGHSWVTKVKSMMLVLSLPQELVPAGSSALAAQHPVPKPARHSVRDLLAKFKEPFPVDDLACAVCGLRDQEGYVHVDVVAPAPEVIVMRLNRYTTEVKANHDIYPDMDVDIAGKSYDLCAVLQHCGHPFTPGTM